MEKEITSKFKNCFADDILNSATIKILDSETKEILATVKMRPLSYGEMAENLSAKTTEYLYLSIVEWDITDGNGLVPVTKNAVDNLTAQIGFGLLEAFRQLNFVSEVEEKNSVKQ
jgi:hypothetical protein